MGGTEDPVSQESPGDSLFLSPDSSEMGPRELGSQGFVGGRGDGGGGDQTSCMTEGEQR